MPEVKVFRRRCCRLRSEALIEAHNQLMTPVDRFPEFGIAVRIHDVSDTTKLCPRIQIAPIARATSSSLEAAGILVVAHTALVVQERGRKPATALIALITAVQDV